MNKSDLINELSVKMNVTQKLSRQFLTAFEEVLTESLKEDSSVTLQGFGSFSPWQQSGRPARNPQNGTPCLIPPRTSVKFKPGKFLLEALNERE